MLDGIRQIVDSFIYINDLFLWQKVSFDLVF